MKRLFSRLFAGSGMNDGILIGVGALIEDGQGGVLLVRHRPERGGFWRGTWILPGGMLRGRGDDRRWYRAGGCRGDGTDRRSRGLGDRSDRADRPRRRAGDAARRLYRPAGARARGRSSRPAATWGRRYGRIKIRSRRYGPRFTRIRSGYWSCTGSNVDRNSITRSQSYYWLQLKQVTFLKNAGF